MTKISKEQLPVVEDQLGDMFEKAYLKPMMEKQKLTTRAEVDAKFAEFGTSLTRQRRNYIENQLVTQWIQQQVKMDEEISHQEMLDWYREHLKDYEYPAKARWVQLTARFGHERTERQAYERIAWIGNQALRGADVSMLAKQYSEGPTAAQGGAREWTTQGNLICKALDHALFSQPVGRLGPIIRDQGMLHIVMVVEREEAGRTPYTVAQVEIRKKIQSKRHEERIAKYIEEVRSKTRVTTIFDDPEKTKRFLARLRSPSTRGLR